MRSQRARHSGSRDPRPLRGDKIVSFRDDFDRASFGSKCGLEL
jgi:hypothetical protein